MKKQVLLLITLGLVLFSFVAVCATETGSEEEYDEEEYGPEDPIVWTKPVEAVIFNHSTHTVDVGLSCDDCHDDLFEMEAGVAEENDDFTMATLYDGGYCGACHDGGSAFASDTRCTTCHIGVRGHRRLVGDNSGKHYTTHH
ncbi:MAG: hypothetical protein CSA20_00055 [Deltaproteobacteria bacterium]|nr:MAG: hypothetical protein CSA20_00055 [Deltaproteobacteria bacterium]